MLHISLIVMSILGVELAQSAQGLREKRRVFMELCGGCVFGVLEWKKGIFDRFDVLVPLLRWKDMLMLPYYDSALAFHPRI